jgi:hypothetical protein
MPLRNQKSGSTSQRRCSLWVRDVHAEAIVSKVKDAHVPLGDRVLETVKSIVREYDDESMLK